MIATELRDDFDRFVTEYGNIIRLKTYVSSTSGGTYDDVVYLSSGADTYCFGQHSNVNKALAGVEKKFFEQGLIDYNDSMLYVPGSIVITEYTKIAVGSPPNGTEYEVIPDIGMKKYEIGSTAVYQQLFIRIINNGSWQNEL